MERNQKVGKDKKIEEAKQRVSRNIYITCWMDQMKRWKGEAAMEHYSEHIESNMRDGS